MKNCYSFRRIYFETASAINVGSGSLDPIQDMPIQIDYNGLPTINATSIAGVLRHLYNGDVDSLFGAENKEIHSGSRIFIENATILDESGKPVQDYLLNKKSDYLKNVSKLVQRDHCALDHRGVAKDKAKFDRTVLISGIRFVCEFSIITSNVEQAKEEADLIVKLFNSPAFRLGSATNNGLGKIKVLEVFGREYDLSLDNDKAAFLTRSSSYLENSENAINLPEYDSEEYFSKTYTLEPENFWLFSSGSEDQFAKITPKYEERVDWSNGEPKFIEIPILPGSSIKGALSHRTAYHYNKIKKIFADQISPEEFEKPNAAVVELFGNAKEEKNECQKGRVIVSDIYCENHSEKKLDHVKIDRFTGGAFDGTLFSERVIHSCKLNMEITILPPRDNKKSVDEDIEKAFNLAIKDICGGRLPLGGGTMRGLGTMLASSEEN